jgi:hypothetical protein
MAAASIASAEEQARQTAAADPQPAQDDYYTRRAKSILEAERSAESDPHPLAAHYPGMSIVVCEAGCPGGRTPEAVYVRPNNPSKKASGAATRSVMCVAGCYDANNRPVWQDYSIGDWTTTTVEQEKPRDKLSPIR